MAKTYVLIGATSGIGQPVTVHLAETDADVYAVSRRGDELEAPPGVKHASCDVVSDEPVSPEIEGPVEGLAYFPGTITLKPFHLLRRQDYLRDLEVNYLGAIKTLQRYLPQLKKRKARPSS